MESQTNENTIRTSNPLREIIQTLKNNLLFKSKWSEVNGAMGDLGTYIPIVLALTLSKDLNLGTTLIFTGIYNFITGAIYGIPMPVQPMKSIAAAGISGGSDFGIPEIMAAGILTGGILLVLGVTGLMHLVYKFIPLSVVRGIQLSQGLSFSMAAVNYITKVQDFSKKSKSLGGRSWLGLDGLVLALVCACFIILVNGAGEEKETEGETEIVTTTNPRKRRLKSIIANLPSAFIIFALGIVIAFIRNPNLVHQIKFGPSHIQIIKISKKSWKVGFIKGTIPQLPLSILNSVVAVCKLSSDLFPNNKSLSATSVSVTVGLMNIIGCWFGAMPCCHGAGGLAGQYKFGGRSGGCVALLGVAKMVVGLVVGSSLVVVLERFPVGVLGVLLVFAGVELSMAARDMSTKEEAFVMLVCTSVSLVGSSAAIGFVCGIIVHLILRARKFVSMD